MMKIDTISMDGKSSKIEISEKVFSSEINQKLISHVLYSQIANKKLRKAKTKQRGEISGSTAKIYAQKGTGNARHSSRKAPLFVGGGVAHGPKGGGAYKVRKLNKKEKKTSLISAISQKTSEKNLIIFEDFQTKIKKTKDFNNFLKKNKINNALVVSDLNTKKNIELSLRNIPNIKLIDADYLNTYEILKYKKIIFTKTAAKEIEKRILKNV